MAIYTPEGATQLTITEQTPAPFEPNNFVIERHLTTDAYSLEELEEQLVQAAEARGWEQPTRGENGGYSLSKQLSTGSAGLFIGKSPSLDYVVISLTAH